MVLLMKSDSYIIHIHTVYIIGVCVLHCMLCKFLDIHLANRTKQLQYIKRDSFKFVSLTPHCMPKMSFRYRYHISTSSSSLSLSFLFPSNSMVILPFCLQLKAMQLTAHPMIIWTSCREVITIAMILGTLYLHTRYKQSSKLYLHR